MSKDQETPKPADKAAQEGNDFGGSPTFPNPPSAQPTGHQPGDTAGDTTGASKEFNGSYTETGHHTQTEYDAGDQSGSKED